MNHSPAPWRSTFNSNKERGVRNSGGFICFLPKPNHYAGQDTRYNEELRENEANAALIAAAPEMLELLRDIAYQKRGSEHEKWGIEHAADAAAKLIAKIESIVTA